jgi:hypothetical protein
MLKLNIDLALLLEAFYVISFDCDIKKCEPDAFMLTFFDGETTYLFSIVVLITTLLMY